MLFLLEFFKLCQQVVVVEHPEHHQLRPGQDVVVVKVPSRVKLFQLGVLRMKALAVDSGDVAPVGGEPGQEDVLEVEVRESKPGLVKTVCCVATNDVAGAADEDGIAGSVEPEKLWMLPTRACPIKLYGFLFTERRKITEKFMKQYYKNFLNKGDISSLAKAHFLLNLRINGY